MIVSIEQVLGLSISKCTQQIQQIQIQRICDVIEGQKYHELVIQLIQDTPILILIAFQGLM